MTNTKKQEVAQKVSREDASKSKEAVKITAFLSNKEKNEINFVHTFMLTIPPILGVIGLFLAPIRLPTIIFAVIMYFWTGLGITAGYHRLWSHRAYQATLPVRWALMLGGAGAFEGSIKWWCRNHRAHHRYTDTDKDPYNARNGFFYAHLGWMLVKQNSDKIGWADISDLQKDRLVQWQHKYYPIVSILIGIVLPTCIASLWGDPVGGYFYAGVWKMVFVHHATFFVNSLAHTWGNKTVSDHHTAFDSSLTAMLTLGEGYHNYHHEFPQDYRNGIKFFHYDPTKWLISFLALFKQTYNLKWISKDEVKKARLQMQQRKLDLEQAKLQFGKKFNDLPKLTWGEFNYRIADGEKLVIIEGVIHNVESFVHEHPGGRQTLLNFVGTDATEFFNGKDTIHKHGHSKQARDYLPAMRVGIL